MSKQRNRLLGRHIFFTKHTHAIIAFFHFNSVVILVNIQNYLLFVLISVSGKCDGTDHFHMISKCVYIDKCFLIAQACRFVPRIFGHPSKYRMRRFVLRLDHCSPFSYTSHCTRSLTSAASPDRERHRSPPFISIFMTPFLIYSSVFFLCIPQRNHL